MRIKRSLLYFIFCFSPLFLYSQDKAESSSKKLTTNKQDKKLRFGIKTGFNSSIYLISEFRVEGTKIKEIQNNYKVGYHITSFMRINLKKHFIQPELVYQIYRSELSFDKTQKNPELTPIYATINSELHNIELPFLYGYNFIDKKPYGMAFFIGPKIKYIWESRSNIKFDNFDLENLEEDIKPFNVGGVLGIGVNISQLFFDFRYEQSFLNLSKKINYSPTLEKEEAGKTLFKRRESVISFSIGVLF